MKSENKQEKKNPKIIVTKNGPYLVSGKIKLQIDRVLPLAEAAEAHQILADRENTGKILLLP